MADSLSNAVNVKNFYFSFFRPPYESEGVEKHQDEYYEHSWTYGGEECIGFALAFLLDTACFSICGSDWNTPFIEFYKDEISNSVRNICTKEHIDTHIVHIENQTEIELIEIVLPWTDKGYGIVVKTTGRTIRETQKIAQIIEEEFGYI